MANKRVYRTTFQFRRASARNWYRLNPTLAQGEPGYELDTGKFKIGNGVTPWNKLPYINGSSSAESGVFSADTINGFPITGSPDIIYKASLEKTLYQFNPESGKYETLSKFDEDESGTIIIDSELSLESENAIQNKVVTKALSNKVDKQDGKGLSTNDFTDAAETKLNRIEDGATKTIIDTVSLDAESDNAVSKRVVTQAINNIKITMEDAVSSIVDEVIDSKIETMSLDGGQI